MHSIIAFVLVTAYITWPHDCQFCYLEYQQSPNSVKAYKMFWHYEHIWFKNAINFLNSMQKHLLCYSSFYLIVFFSAFCTLNTLSYACFKLMINICNNKMWRMYFGFPINRRKVHLKLLDHQFDFIFCCTFELIFDAVY